MIAIHVHVMRLQRLCNVIPILSIDEVTHQHHLQKKLRRIEGDCQRWSVPLHREVFEIISLFFAHLRQTMPSLIKIIRAQIHSTLLYSTLLYSTLLRLRVKDGLPDARPSDLTNLGR